MDTVYTCDALEFKNLKAEMLTVALARNEQVYERRDLLVACAQKSLTIGIDEATHSKVNADKASNKLRQQGLLRFTRANVSNSQEPSNQPNARFL